MDTIPLVASLFLAPLLGSCNGAASTTETKKNQRKACNGYCAVNLPLVTEMVESIRQRTRKTHVRFSSNFSYHDIGTHDVPDKDLWYTDEDYLRFEQEECDRITFKRKIRARIRRSFSDGF